MSEMNRSLKIELGFEDLSTRTYTIADIAEEMMPQISLIKEHVNELKKVFKGETEGIDQTVIDYGTNMKKVFVSKEGAPLLDIVGVRYITEQVEVVYSG